MTIKIPAPIISLLSDNLSVFETHASLDSLFMYADAPGEPPAGSKAVKVQEWLRAANKTHEDPMGIVAKLIEGYLDDPRLAKGVVDIPLFDAPFMLEEKRAFCRRLEGLFSKYGFQYMPGGQIAAGASVPSKTLESLIQGRDMPAIEHEFSRALEHVIKEPRESISAACNILESVFKIYIHDNNLEMPQKQDLQGVFKVVRSDLGLDSGRVEDEDLKRIISGLLSTVDGVGALRTHASSAHGQGRKSYKIEPRHARLAINSAHTLTIFILETWDHRLRSL